MRALARLIAAGALNLQIEGRLPLRGPAVVALRHFHNLWDGVALLAAAKSDVHVVVALDWATTATVRWAMERLTRAARWPVLLRSEAFAGERGAVPRARPSAYRASEETRYRMRCIRQCITLLEHDAIVAVFPEAYPVIDPAYAPQRDHHSLLAFRPGFARLACIASRRLGRAVPVIPTGLCYEKARRWRVRIRIGSPIDAGPTTDTVQLVGRVQREVARLSRTAEVPTRHASRYDSSPG